MSKRKSSGSGKSTAGIRGKIREDYFACGGSLEGWRGTAATHTNKRDKRNDRNSQRNKAIEESWNHDDE
jgi:hypothetical protein